MVTTTTYDGIRDSPNAISAWTVTDYTEDLALDCNTDNAALGNNLGTLIKQLIQLGILKGSVVTV
jgi:hypothetical protein